MELTRRDVLRLGALGTVGAAALAVPIGSAVRAKGVSALSSRNFPRRYAASLSRPPVLQPRSVSGGTAYYEVTARQSSASIVPGLSTPVYGYDGVVGGGPLIDVDQGTEVVLRVRNHMPEAHPLHGHAFDLSTHLHGSASLPEYDGYAGDITPRGHYKDYRYPNFQPARTLWYHDHAQHMTAQNVYSGLAAFYLLHDPWERENLPQGEFDVPLMVSDAMFASDGRLAYDDNTHSGLWGDVILVNGAPWPVMRVKRAVYRFRILVATLARSFRFRLSNGATVHMVGTDGGLMPRSVPVTSWRHAGAERYEILVDFRNYAPGTRIELLNASNKNNRDYDFTNKVMAFDVVGDPVDRQYTIPSTLVPSPIMTAQPTSSMVRRSFRVKRDDVTNEWTFGDTTWGQIVSSGYTHAVADPARGATEVWTVENKSGGWFHPVHIHLVDFRILSRNGRAPFPHERGPKDVVYVGEDEKVELLVTFAPHAGRYMVHCHNLPHEDHDMMAQFNVGNVSPASDPHDPIYAAPAVPDPDFPA